MAKRNRPYNPRRTLILSVSLSDGSGTFFKRKGPLEQTRAGLSDYILEKGLTIDIPGGRGVRRKKDKR